MDIRKLQRVIVNALEDVKAQDIKIFNTSKQTALFERVIVATANSNRQTRALGHHVFMEVKENGGDAVGIEGLETGEWVLVDITLRMLKPAELYRAQGFPESYAIDKGAAGEPITKTAQVRMCGNSVCPPLARAIVAANYAQQHAAQRRAA